MQEESPTSVPPRAGWRSRFPPVLRAVTLLGILLAAATIKARQFPVSPRGVGDDAGVFRSESAFQYRYARMTAQGQDLPEPDRAAQWPEGLPVRPSLALTMERLCGWSFRAAHAAGFRVPFLTFTVWFLALFTSLSALAVYAAARAAGGRPWPSVMAAALYAFAGASFDRVRFFEHEYVAVPLLFFSSALVLKALQGGRRTTLWAVLAGALAGAALSAWHMSSFYLLCFEAALAAAWIACGSHERQRALVVTLAGFLPGPLLAGLLVPYLRAGHFLLSPPVLALLLLLTATAVGFGTNAGWRQRLFLSLVVLGVTSLAVAFRSPGGTYDHAWGFLFYRLGHPFAPPSDWSSIPAGVRTMWYEGFDPMSASYLLYGFGLLLPLGLWGLGAAVRQAVRAVRVRPADDGAADPSRDVLLILLGAGFGVLGLLLNRFGVFAAFFLAVCSVFLFPRAAPSPSAETPLFRHPAVTVPALFLLLAFHVGQAFAYEGNFLRRNVTAWWPDKPAPPKPVWFAADEQELMDWIRGTTPTSAVFLANIELSAGILLETGRALNLHPKFEVPGMPAKFRKTVAILYGTDEEALERWLEEQETAYLVWPAGNALDRGPHSYRFLAARERLPAAALAYRLHFQSGSFRCLRLVFRNRAFQVYRRVPKGSPPSSWKPDSFPRYDENLVRRDRSEQAVLDDGLVDAVLRAERRTYDWILRADALARAGRMREALLEVRDAVKEGMPDGNVWHMAARIAAQANAIREALACAELASRMCPNNGRYRADLAVLYHRNGSSDLALQAAREAVDLGHVAPAACLMAAQVLRERGNLSEARQWVGRVLALDPLHPEALSLDHQLRAARRPSPP